MEEEEEEEEEKGEEADNLIKSVRKVAGGRFFSKTCLLHGGQRGSVGVVLD